MANRFPLLPGRNSAILGGKRAKNQFLALKWSDYGLFENCQDRKMQFFMANRFPLLPGQNSANIGGKRAKNQNLKNFSRDLFLGGIYF